MITPAYRQTILEMANKDVSIREVSRTMKVSRNTVRDVLKKGANHAPIKESKYDRHLPVIKELFRECRGNAVRIQEELASRHDINIPYQSLTWIVRKEELGTRKKKRAGEYVFAPGEEMQHDTSPHNILFGGRKTKAQCAALVLAYSRRDLCPILSLYYPF